MKTLIKRWTRQLVLSLLLTGLPLASAYAQGELKKHTAGLQVGQVWLAGEISENVENNIGYGALYEYTASDVFSAQASFMRSSHDEILTITSTGLAFKANLFFYDQLVPYALVGMGLYFVNQDIIPAESTTPVETVSATVFGLNVGLGADLNLGEDVFSGMQFSLHNLFSSTQTTETLGKQEISGRFANFLIRAGYRF